MTHISIKKMALVAAVSLSFYHTHTWQEVASAAITRTCPCNMVPVISETTNVKKVVKTFKKVSPRSQRSQLVGFIKQYVSDPNKVTESVMAGCAKAYSERVKSEKVYKLVLDLIDAKVKQPIQAKVMLVLGKVLRDAKPESCPLPAKRSAFTQAYIVSFKDQLPAQQRTELAGLVAQYISRPTDEREEVLIACAQIYCERVQSQNLNKLIQKLITGYDQESVQRQIMQLLGLH